MGRSQRPNEPRTGRSRSTGPSNRTHGTRTGGRTRPRSTGPAVGLNYRQSRLFEGELVHPTSNQRVMYETHICPVFNHALRPEEQFNPSTAQALMNKFHRKREAHCHVSLVEDAMLVDAAGNTRRGPRRPRILYSEIADVTRSTTKPEYVTLGVANRRNMQRYYQGYKFKNPACAGKFLEYVNKARSDRSSRLYPSRAQSADQIVDYEPRPVNRVDFDFETSMETLPRHSRYDSSPYRPPSVPPQTTYTEPPSQKVVYSMPPAQKSVYQTDSMYNIPAVEYVTPSQPEQQTVIYTPPPNSYPTGTAIPIDYPTYGGTTAGYNANPYNTYYT